MSAPDKQSVLSAAQPAQSRDVSTTLLSAPEEESNATDTIVRLSDHSEVDPYLRPAFAFWNRVRRAFWAASWFILFRFTPPPFFWWRSMVLRVFGAKIGPNNFIYPSARIWAPWHLETEEVVTIGRGTEIYNPGGAVFKHHSIISQNAYVCGASHDYNDPGFSFQSKRIVLEPYAWVCARAIVLPGVTMGEGSVLGAGSVTARSLEPWWVYAGNPARRTKARKQQESLKRGTEI